MAKYDPIFKDAGSGGLGIENVEGYKLLPGSPCIDNGILLDNHGNKDYWGNPVQENMNPDCGIHESKIK